MRIDGHSDQGFRMLGVDRGAYSAARVVEVLSLANLLLQECKSLADSSGVVPGFAEFRSATRSPSGCDPQASGVRRPLGCDPQASAQHPGVRPTKL